MEQIHRESKKRVLEEAPKLCLAPWIHLHSSINGTLYPCCVVQSGADVENFGTLDQFIENGSMNNSSMCKMRKNMLDGMLESRCTYCYKAERDGLVSFREMFNLYFGHHFPLVETTNRATGYVESAKPTYWDIRFSNRCNLRCRICSHEYSSAWFEENNVTPYLKRSTAQRFVSSSSDFEKVLSDLSPYYDTLETLYFAGGEVLLSDEHYRLLELLQDQNKTDTYLIYNTNMTVIGLNNYRILKYWKCFAFVEVLGSIDAIGKRCEYIRHGLQWDQILTHWKAIRSETPHVILRLNPTISIFSAWTITDLHRQWVELGLIQHHEIELNYLYYPQNLSAQILPITFRKKIAGKIKNHINWLNETVPAHFDEQESMMAMWEGFVTFIESGDLSEYRQEFIEQTIYLDQIRGESFRETFPELGEIYPEIYS